MSSSASATSVGMGVGLAAVGAAVAARVWYGAPAAIRAGGMSPKMRELGGEGGDVHDAKATLRIELQGLRINELRARAKQAALDEAAIDDALDSDDPKAAMVDVLLENIATTTSANQMQDAIALGKSESAEDVNTVADSGQAELRTELASYRSKALQKRALAEGLDADAVEDALDEDNPKVALIELIVAAVQQRAPAHRLLSCLSSGGDAAANAIERVLEQGMHVFEQLSVTASRRERKSVREALESLERACETVDGAWCDGILACGDDELSVLVGHLLGVQALASGKGGSDTSVSDQVSIVSDMLDCLDWCSSSVVQSVCTLRRCSSDPHGSVESIIGAMEVLRGLCPESVVGEATCDDAEVAAFELVLGRMSGCDECVGGEVVSGCMSLFTLGCRNGMAVCGESNAMIALVWSLRTRWYGHISGLCGEDELLSGAAMGALAALATYETIPKVPPDRRVSLETLYVKLMKQGIATIDRVLSTRRVEEVCDAMMEANMLSHKDISLACGESDCLIFMFFHRPASMTRADDKGVFSRLLELYFRVLPASKSAEFWVGACSEIDVTTARLNPICGILNQIKRFEGATASSWWPALLDLSIEMLKTNSSAGLSERDTMCFWPVAAAATILEVAARHESQHSLLMASGVVEALEYSIIHDFSFMGASVAAYAAGAAVALVGRQEGGRTLSREAVFAVLKQFLHGYIAEGSPFSATPIRTMLPIFQRVVTLAVSDANKKHMVEFEPLVDMLLECLLLDESNRRYGQDGHDTLQEASAGVIQELALYGPSCALLRSHGAVLSALRRLVEVGTKLSRERGAAALFELDAGTRVAARSSSAVGGVSVDGTSAADGGAPPPPHVMMSYNWDHQNVILRVVGSLQSRGYFVWIDTEQMKGSTVDTMALAVEGSAVVLIGVSRAYKESSNCRMEAQYAFQKKKAIVPLKLTDGYEADGWLGLLLGTSMWYAFYGSTLSSESAFESRVESLARELGARAKRDAAAVIRGKAPVEVSAEELSTSTMSSIDAMYETTADDGLLSALALELRQMRVLALQQRALEVGMPREAVEDAMESNDSKSVLIDQIVDIESHRGPVDRVSVCLKAGGDGCAAMISGVLDHAMDLLEACSTASPRKSRRALRDLSDRVETVMENVDAEWCDGVSRCSHDEIGRLSGLLVSIQALSSSSGVSEVSDAVTAALDCLDRCGSIVVQSIFVVSGGDSDSASALSALELLRGLSEEHLDAVSADEACAFDMVMNYVSGLDECFGDEFVSGCMAMFTLGCRNGTVLCGRAEVAEMACGQMSKWYEYASGGSITDYTGGAASGAIYCLSFYCIGKMPPESRGPVDRSFEAGLKTVFNSAAKGFSEADASKLYIDSMRAGITTHEDLSLACGWPPAVSILGHTHPSSLPAANDAGVISSALTLYRRVEPSPLPASWWTDTYCLIDITSCRLACLWTGLASVKRLSSTLQSSWWGELLDHAIRMVKLNASAGLSGRATMCFVAVVQALGIIELAAQDKSQHDMLLESGVTDALEYAILNDFTVIGISIAAYASGAAVSLMGTYSAQ